MEEAYLYTHLGLGDMLICNGLVRNLSKKFDKINLFCKPKYIKHARAMYSDLNINLISKDDVEAILYLNQLNPRNLLIVGHNRMEEAYRKTNFFNVAFYILSDIHYMEQWNNFHFARDTEKEEKIFSDLCLNKEKYIFLHEDISRGYTIDKESVCHKNLRIISPTRELDEKLGVDNIFLYSKILENATEIHTIDSSFLWLADQLKIKTKNLFLHTKHRYVPSLTFYDWKKVN